MESFSCIFQLNINLCFSARACARRKCKNISQFLDELCIRGWRNANVSCCLFHQRLE